MLAHRFPAELALPGRKKGIKKCRPFLCFFTSPPSEFGLQNAGSWCLEIGAKGVSRCHTDVHMHCWHINKRIPQNLALYHQLEPSRAETWRNGTWRPTQPWQSCDWYLFLSIRHQRYWGVLFFAYLIAGMVLKRRQLPSSRKFTFTSFSDRFYADQSTVGFRITYSQIYIISIASYAHFRGSAMRYSFVMKWWDHAPWCTYQNMLHSPA